MTGNATLGVWFALMVALVFYAYLGHRHNKKHRN